jgi:hypothetical protein
MTGTRLAPDWHPARGRPHWHPVPPPYGGTGAADWHPDWHLDLGKQHCARRADPDHARTMRDQAVAAAKAAPRPKETTP